MKRAAIPLILLLCGFVLGLLCSVSLRHPAASTPAAVIQKEETPEESAQNTTGLLRTAAAVTDAIQAQDYETLSTYVHPTRAVSVLLSTRIILAVLLAVLVILVVMVQRTQLSPPSGGV